MSSSVQKILIVAVSIIIACLSYRLPDGNDFLWSIRYAIIPVLVTMLTLYTTLSMNLVKELDDLPEQFRERAMQVVDSIKFEIRLELIMLLITFSLLVINAFFTEKSIMKPVFRCVIDGLIIIDIVNFIIAIIDTFFGYLELIKAQK